MAMGIRINSPSVAMAYPSTPSSAASHRRLRPSLPSIFFLLLHASLFLYWQRAWRDSTPSPSLSANLPPSALAVSPSSSAVSSSPPTLASQSCEVCHLNPLDPLCEYGEDNIRLSRQYEGSGARLRKVLEKALRGEEVNVGVLGASVTQGHGVAQGLPRWEDKFFADFQKMFPKAKLHVGAVGAMDSRFFAYCFEALIPKEMDLFVLELDINNRAALDQLRDDDTLMRSLLQLPQQPAVVRVSVFALLFDEMAQGIVSDLVTSQFFDVPVIGIRNFLLPHTLHHREAAEELFSMDPWNNRDYRHISHHAHRALGDMLSLFIRKEVCEVQRRQSFLSSEKVEATGPWPTGEDLGRIPPLAIWSSWLKNVPLVPVHPSCQTTVSPFSPLIPYSHSKAFTRMEWNGKSAWGANRPGSQIRFKFTGTSVGLFVWSTNGQSEEEMSSDQKVRRETAPGQAMCWIEQQEMDEEEWEKEFGDEENPAESNTWLLNSHIPSKYAPGPEFMEVAEGLHYGEHVLACEVSAMTTSGGWKWRVMGVASQ